MSIDTPEAPADPQIAPVPTPEPEPPASTSGQGPTAYSLALAVLVLPTVLPKILRKRADSSAGRGAV